LVAQMQAQDLAFDEIVVPSGSGATHAGLLFGLRALGIETPVTGICVRRDAESQRPRLTRRCSEIAELLEMRSPVDASDIRLSDEVLAPGYGRMNLATKAAILEGARREALMLDPVYSGRTLAGALAIARTRAADDRLLFLHTGGSPAIFAYGDQLL
jgi:1-aminocyclopropane-1-carboxylate deaminase/D-cysteine desulfhydrase-like pyridoxal-dependent ACC family enzyme